MKNGRDGRTEARMREARLFFERHNAHAVPDAGFASRVASRLTRDPAETLGWAALRLLPASLLLALVLGYVSLRSAPGNETVQAPPGDDDVIAWVLDGREAGR